MSSLVNAGLSLVDAGASAIEMFATCKGWYSMARNTQAADCGLNLVCRAVNSYFAVSIKSESALIRRSPTLPSKVVSAHTLRSTCNIASNVVALLCVANLAKHSTYLQETGAADTLAQASLVAGLASTALAAVACIAPPLVVRDNDYAIEGHVPAHLQQVYAWEKKKTSINKWKNLTLVGVQSAFFMSQTGNTVYQLASVVNSACAGVTLACSAVELWVKRTQLGSLIGRAASAAFAGLRDCCHL